LNQEVPAEPVGEVVWDAGAWRAPEERPKRLPKSEKSLYPLRHRDHTQFLHPQRGPVCANPRRGTQPSLQAGLLAPGSFYRPRLPLRLLPESGFHGFRPRLQRRDRPRFSRGSLL